MSDFAIDRPRYVFASLLAVQAAVGALAAVHPERDRVLASFRYRIDGLLAQLLNSGFSDEDLAGLHEQAKVLEAALGATTPRPPSSPPGR